MLFENRENELVKTVDGREFFISRSVAVVPYIIVTIDTEFYFLMVKRGPGCPNEIGKWCLPCGYLDWDETSYEACLRETYEETKFDATPYLSKQPWFVNTNIANTNQNVTIHHCGVVSGEKALTELPALDKTNLPNQECEDIKWFKYSDIIKSKDIAFNQDENIVDLMTKHLQ